MERGRTEAGNEGGSVSGAARKGLITEPNRRKRAFASNSAWVVPAGADGRRYCVIDVPPITKNKRRRRDKAA